MGRNGVAKKVPAGAGSSSCGALGSFAPRATAVAPMGSSFPFPSATYTELESASIHPRDVATSVSACERVCGSNSTQALVEPLVP